LFAALRRIFFWKIHIENQDGLAVGSCECELEAGKDDFLFVSHRTSSVIEFVLSRAHYIREKREIVMIVNCDGITLCASKSFLIRRFLRVRNGFIPGADRSRMSQFSAGVLHSSSMLFPMPARYSTKMLRQTSLRQTCPWLPNETKSFPVIAKLCILLRHIIFRSTFQIS
jgi:hypothetical protein